MSIIKDFNNRLNNSFTKRSSNDVSFSKNVDVILKSTILRSKRFRQVLIIGAGKMEDFSLHFFLKFYDKVILTDIDTKSIKDRLKELSINKNDLKRIIVKEVEYTGFEEAAFFKDFRTEILKIKTFEEIDSFIQSKMEYIQKYTFLYEYFGKSDFIYVSPIYTQLIYNQILLECSLLRESGSQENLLKYIENIMLDEMVEVIDRFNSNIVNLLSDEGSLFVLSDVFEVDVGSEFDLRITSGIKDKNVMDRIYQQYQEKYGMGLGDYGLYNLDEKVKGISYRWLKWPFKENTNLIIKQKIYENKII